MNAFNLAQSGTRRRLPELTLAILLSLSLVAFHFSAAAVTQSIQTLQSIDLGATPNAANIQILGAASGDHLSGNGAPGVFSTLPRAHAIAVGDLNNDGFGDVVVGAPDADFTPAGGSARADAGAVYILFGRATFASPTVVDTNLTAISQPDVKIFGATAGDNAGFAVAAGDVNGDGLADLVLGAPGFDLSLPGPPVVDRQNAGVVYILFGGASFSARTIDLSIANSVNVAVIGAQAGDRFGAAFAIGDVNGATSPRDLLVGAPGSSGPAAARTNGGAAYLLFGGAGLGNTGTTTRVIDLAAPGTFSFDRVFGKTGSRLGSSVMIGDINAGGANDAVLGAPTANRPDQAGDVAETGAVFALFGGGNLTPTAPATTKTFDINTTQQDVSIYGASANDHLGASVAVGNVNNDGATDLIIGAPEADGPSDLRADAGEAYVITGGTNLNPPCPNPPQCPTERRIDVSIGTVSLTIFGAATGDHLGAEVAAGAVNTMGNNDTIADVIVGSPGALSAKGTVSILFGGANLLLFAARDVAIAQDDIRIIGQAAGDELGWALATGDIDNNRGGDLAIGAPFNDVTVAVGSTRPDSGKAYVLLAASENVPPQNQNPVVIVAQPNGGETIQGGTTYQIQWAASDGNGDDTIQSFEVRLSTDGGATFNTILASNLNGAARSFGWNVPTGVNTATARVRLTAFDNAGGQGQDDSNTNFAITDVGVLVTVTAPNVNESLKWDQPFNITWTVGTGMENQVKGFDLFYTTDNGVTFAAITAPNPTQPALGPAVRSFNWTVPRICTSSAKVVVRATSITNAVSSDSSNLPFSIGQPPPQIDPLNMYFTKGNKQINLLVMPTSQPLFVEGVKLEISTNQAGTAFVMVPDVAVKDSGNRIISKGRINEDRIGIFFPDGARRMIRVTNQTCGIVVLRVVRAGQVIAIDTAAAAEVEAPTVQRWQ